MRISGVYVQVVVGRLPGTMNPRHRMMNHRRTMFMSSVVYLIPGTHSIVRGTTGANHSHSRTLGIAGAILSTTYTESLTREASVAGASRVGDNYHFLVLKIIENLIF